MIMTVDNNISNNTVPVLLPGRSDDSGSNDSGFFSGHVQSGTLSQFSTQNKFMKHLGLTEKIKINI